MFVELGQNSIGLFVLLAVRFMIVRLMNTKVRLGTQ